MKERPILMSGPMVRAVLDGRKRQTRRIITPQPTQIPSSSKGASFWLRQEHPTKAKPGKFAAGPPSHFHVVGRSCPAAPGDRLWVRETFAAKVSGCPAGLSYAADHVDPRGDGPANPMKWTPSIHMPRWASRLTLEVTEVRVERLQDISEEDAKAEGLTQTAEGRWLPGRCDYARWAFSELWSSIYGDASWAANPWVWALSFDVVDKART